MKEKVVVSRKWNASEIELYVDFKEVGARMDLVNFKNAIIEHIGNPAMLMTKAQLSKVLDEAVIAVVAEMKAQTIHII
jgi:predicted nucleotidyltransferase